MAPQQMGKRIKALRDERGFSQDDLARLFGFKDQTDRHDDTTGTVGQLILAEGIVR